MKFSSLLPLLSLSLPSYCLGDNERDAEIPKISSMIKNLMVKDDIEIVSGKANYDKGNFDVTSDNHPKNLRDLGSKNTTCIDREEFLQVSQRYIVLQIFDKGGIFPLKYNPGLEDPKDVEKFDDCKFVGMHCTGGILHRILLKDQGVVGFDAVYPPDGVELLLDLQVLDLSENTLISELNPKINQLPNLRVLDISYSGLRGELGCPDNGQARFITYGGASGGKAAGGEDNTQSDFVCKCPTDICYDLGDGGLQQADDDITIDDGITIDDNNVVIEDGSVIVSTSGGNRRQLGDGCVHTGINTWQKFQQNWALAELFYNTNIIASTKKSGDTTVYGGVDSLYSSNECLWLGVTCNEFGLVTRLSLNGEGLTSGRAVLSKFNTENFNIEPDNILPDSLTWLESLEVLDLSNNRILVGKLPEDFHHLRNLRLLDVSITQITGKIRCNKGGLSKVVSFGGTQVNLGEDTGHGSTLSSQNGDIKTEGSWEQYKDGDGYLAGAVRFGINCACSKDICLQKKADIKVKPYDRK